MPITIPTRATLTTNVKAFFTSRFPGRNLGTEGFLGKTWRALAMVLWQLEKAVQDADRDACPTDDTSTAGLDRWAETLGLSNGDGSYGRRASTVATGGVVQATGTNGTVIANGTVAYASDGVTAFEVTGGPYTIAGGVASVTMEATTGGVAGNLDTGEVVTWVSPPAGLDASASVTTAFAGGLDEETDAALLSRIEYRLTYPPKGGAASDYRTWCENATVVSTGVAIPIARAYVYPRRSGTGTVDVVVTVAGEAQARKPSATQRSNVEAYLDTVRPVTVEGANVLLPYMPNGQGLTIRARLVPARTATEFDWDDTAAAYPTVKAGGTTTLLRINGSPPAALQEGDRIQIANTATGAPVKAEQRVVLDIDTATINPDTILTLDSALTVYPTAGNTIYAGGPGVTATIAAIYEYANGLGPARDSGFAWADDLWESSMSIARITASALNTLDGSGDRYWSNIVTGGILIDGVANDVAATDSIANGPQILYPDLIVVTK